MRTCKDGCDCSARRDDFPAGNCPNCQHLDILHLTRAEVKEKEKEVKEKAFAILADKNSTPELKYCAYEMLGIRESFDLNHFLNFE